MYLGYFGSHAESAEFAEAHIASLVLAMRDILQIVLERQNIQILRLLRFSREINSYPCKFVRFVVKTLLNSLDSQDLRETNIIREIRGKKTSKNNQ